jgi:hypothetical protein
LHVHVKDLGSCFAFERVNIVKNVLAIPVA